MILEFGGGAEADTFYTVFEPMIGWTLEVNGRDYALISIDTEGFGQQGGEWIGFNLYPWEDGGPDPMKLTARELNEGGVFIAWDNIEKVVVY